MATGVDPASSSGQETTGEPDPSSSSSSSETGSESSTGEPAGGCPAVDVHDPFVACTESSAGSLTPAVEWEWSVEGERLGSPPLVINLTDDNGDGYVDLCDTPDVVALSCEPQARDFNFYGTLAVLDGATGSVHWTRRVRCETVPAAGDVDGDGEPEIFTYGDDHLATLLSGSGEVEQQSHPTKDFGGVLPLHASMVDLDNDGDVEIVNGHLIFDHTLDVVEVLPLITGRYHTVVDLDADDDAEIVWQGRAFHHDGTEMWSSWTAEDPNWSYEVTISPAIVVNADDDDDPELAYGTEDGLWLREHDGTDKMLIGFDAILGSTYLRPRPVAADFDGDAQIEIALADLVGVRVVELDGGAVWSWAEEPTAHLSQLVAFDFLGQGRPQVVATHELQWAMIDDGQTVGGNTWPDTGSFAIARGSTIADVDNDGAAEILVAERSYGGSLRAYGAQDGSWVRARRIWNQLDYHVTNVSETGQIPVVEPRWWLTHDTFGTQAQITADAELCTPR